MNLPITAWVQVEPRFWAWTGRAEPGSTGRSKPLGLILIAVDTFMETENNSSSVFVIIGPNFDESQIHMISRFLSKCLFVTK